MFSVTDMTQYISEAWILKKKKQKHLQLNEYSLYEWACVFIIDTHD